MTTIIERRAQDEMTTGKWAAIGLAAAAASVLAVLFTQAIILTIWPELARFKPLESYARSALFTLVPALGATGILAWLAARKEDAVSSFKKLAVIVLILSLIPDYALPVAHRTLPASTAAAFLHVVAAAATVLVVVSGYRRLSGN